MTPGKKYYYAKDLLAYFDAKGIKWRLQELKTKGYKRILITKKSEDDAKDSKGEIKQVTAFVLSNDYIENIASVGFLKDYLIAKLHQITKIQDYSNLKLIINDLKEKEYKA